MLNENYIAPYYQKIANVLNSIVPVDWEDIVMYGEELGDIGSVGIYFKPVGEDKYHYGGMIPDEYGVDLNEYFERTDELLELIKSLWIVFKDSEIQKWDTITFKLNNQKKFNVKFGYKINREISSLEREIIWAYEELGIIPEDDFSKKVIEEYLA